MFACNCLWFYFSYLSLNVSNRLTRLNVSDVDGGLDPDAAALIWFIVTAALPPLLFPWLLDNVLHADPVPFASPPFCFSSCELFPNPKTIGSKIYLHPVVKNTNDIKFLFRTTLYILQYLWFLPSIHVSLACSSSHCLFARSMRSLALSLCMSLRLA